MRRALRILFISVTACALSPAAAEWSPSTDPLDLAARYAAFVDTFDAGAIEERYPAAVEKIRSEDRKTKLEAVRTLAATGEIDALPKSAASPVAAARSKTTVPARVS